MTFEAAQTLKANYKALYCNCQAGLAVAHDQAAVLLPYILVAPRLFAAHAKDVLTLGTLTQTAMFGKVFDSLSIVSENGSPSTNSSVLRRLREYEPSLPQAPRVHEVEIVAQALD